MKHIEGHYIRGYGDGTSKAESAEIYVLPKGREAAQAFLELEPDAQKCLERVSNLIYGFETPYGVELLATVHWVATKESNPAQDSEQAIALVHEWSDRSSLLFKPEHIRKAWQRLHEQNWLNIEEGVRSQKSGASKFSETRKFTVLSLGLNSKLTNLKLSSCR